MKKPKEFNWDKYNHYSMEAAIKMIHGKRGAGKAKKTRVSMTFEFEGSITRTESLLHFMAIIPQAITDKNVQMPARLLKIDETVQTELEENENWNDRYEK